MDPLGFALENYDAIGRWRDNDGVAPIDAKISLDGADGRQPEGVPRGADRPQATVRPNGHGEDADLRLGPRRGLLRPANGAADRSASWRATNIAGRRSILGIVQSMPFQMRARVRKKRAHSRFGRSTVDRRRSPRCISARCTSDRRTVLRGLGATIALPLLDSMVPALTARSRTAAAPVRRLGVFYVPNGMSMPYWSPKTEGPLAELPPTLRSLRSSRRTC